MFAGSEPDNEVEADEAGCLWGFPLICEFCPSRHFVENTLMMLSSGLLGQPVAQPRKFKILN